MPPTQSLAFIHLSDVHLVPNGRLDEIDKARLPEATARRAEDVLRKTLQKIKAQLEQRGVSIAGVLISGDVALRGGKDAAKSLKKILIDGLKFDIEKIVVVPGNHDVASGLLPSDKLRYETFVSTWRSATATELGARTPVLDAVDYDDDKEFDLSLWQKHCLHTRGVIVLPINSSHWSQTKEPLDDKLTKAIEEIATLASKSSKKDANKLRKEIMDGLENLTKHDPARISPGQMSAIKQIIEAAAEGSERHLTIAVMHHHCLPVDEREEQKTFADIINLGSFRQFLRDAKVNVLVHGHKHHEAVFFDHIYGPEGVLSEPHPVLIISGPTKSASPALASLQIIEVCNLPHAPEVRITPVSLESPSTRMEWHPAVHVPLWSRETGKSPIVVRGTNLQEVYQRAQALVHGKPSAEGKMLICCLDVANWRGDEPQCLGPTSPFPADHGAWLQQTASWWQRVESHSKSYLPFLHGARLKAFGGWVDQVARAKEVLKDRNSATSRAVAVLIDPVRDFGGKDESGLPAFSLVQFRRRHGATDYIDAVAYYRAQEIDYWWPVNVVELWHLLDEVAKAVHAKCGEITTIAADARLTGEDAAEPQVAVPSVDQWRDMEPNRIVDIARALVQPADQLTADEEKKRTEALALWQQCLAHIRETAGKKYNAEGVAVPVAGLIFLRDCVEAAAAPGDKDHAALVDALKSLAEAGLEFAHSKKDSHHFQLWCKLVNKPLAILEALTKEVSS